MNATKRAQVPFGLRKKLMAATSMLLVAAIMLVSTSYAWFTLSTAPEITGITTSVGANGNLEIALLDTYHAAHMEEISSATGTSIDATDDATVSNLTWGNLIDLSHASYGLGNIKMYPSALNVNANSEGDAFNHVIPLMTPSYGSDGRVTTLAGTTTTAVYNAEKGAFETNAATTDYGVRAVGAASNTSPRQLAFTSAKVSVSQGAAGAQSATKGVVQTHSKTLLSLAVAGSTPTSYDYAQVESMRAIAAGVQNSLNSIVSTYANAIIAKAASDSGINEEAFALINSALSGVTKAQTLIEALSTYNVTNEYTNDLNELKTAQDNVAAVLSKADALLKNNTSKEEFTATTAYDGNDAKTDLATITDDIVKPLIGGTSGMKAYDGENNAVSISGTPIEQLFTKVKAVYIGDGAVKTVADYTGTFKVTEALDVSVYAGVNKNDKAGNVTESNKLAGVKTTVDTLQFNASGEATDNISDFYGYIVDFAFRTNAANSNLLLQTEGVNRVYTNTTLTNDNKTPATMGGGSFATFNYGDSDMTFEQGKKLLEAFRVVFFNPENGEIYARAKFGELPATESEGATSLTGKLKLTSSTTTEGKYTLGQDAYELEKYVLKTKVTIGGVEYDVNSTNFGTYASEISKDDWAGASLEATSKAPTSTGGSVTDTGTLGKDAYEPAYKVKSSFTVGSGADEVTLNTTNDADVSKCNAFEETLTAVKYAQLTKTTAKGADTTTDNFNDGTTIVSLPQNQAMKVSVLVYLDGTNIDNAAVNAMGTSGTLNMNIQFASSAQLTPMENNTLKNLAKDEGAGTNP